MKRLTLDFLQKESKIFAVKESVYKERSLYGVTDGKAAGIAPLFIAKLFKNPKYKRLDSCSSVSLEKPTGRNDEFPFMAS